MNVDHLPFAFFALIAISLLFRAWRYKGFRGAFLGRPVSRTVGEVHPIHKGLGSHVLKVHALAGAGAEEPAIAIESLAKSFLGFRMTLTALPLPEARKLAGLLEQASAELRDARGTSALGLR